MLCPICGAEPEHTETKYGLRLDCCGLWAWGDNPLIDGKTHRARKVAHSSFDMLWQKGYMSRTEAYAALAKHMHLSSKECHIKKMSAKQCEKVIMYAVQTLTKE